MSSVSVARGLVQGPASTVTVFAHDAITPGTDIRVGTRAVGEPESCHVQNGCSHPVHRVGYMHALRSGCIARKEGHCRCAKKGGFPVNRYHLAARNTLLRLQPPPFLETKGTEPDAWGKSQVQLCSQHERVFLRV